MFPSCKNSTCLTEVNNARTAAGLRGFAVALAVKSFRLEECRAGFLELFARSPVSKRIASCDILWLSSNREEKASRTLGVCCVPIRVPQGGSPDYAQVTCWAAARKLTAVPRSSTGLLRGVILMDRRHREVRPGTYTKTCDVSFIALYNPGSGSTAPTADCRVASCEKTEDAEVTTASVVVCLTTPDVLKSDTPPFT